MYPKDVFKIMCKRCSIIQTFKQCTNKWSHKAIFKNMFKYDSKLIIKTPNEISNDLYICVQKFGSKSQGEDQELNPNI